MTMETIPAVVWAGKFDEKLHEITTVFSSTELPQKMGQPGPFVRSLFFDEHTVETLCKAAIMAEDAVMRIDTAGARSYHPTSMLSQTEKEKMFSMAHSPFHCPLIGLSNIARDYLERRGALTIDLNATIFLPLKKNWSRLVQHLWDHPSRSLGAQDMFQSDRYLVPHIFCRIVEADPSFSRIICDDSDLTIPLMTRNWVHATSKEELGELCVFFLLLIPRSGDPGTPPTSAGSLHPFNVVREGEVDTTITTLRRILHDSGTIVKFVQATALHLSRFRGFEAKTVLTIVHRFWSWARFFRQDPLCSEFLRVLRTSSPFWKSCFEASMSVTGHHTGTSFTDTIQSDMSDIVATLMRCRDSSSEAMALTELFVSTGVFEALEVAIGEVLHRGTEDEQVMLCENLQCIYQGLSYGRQGSPSFASLMRQRLPHPRTVRMLWDLSLKLSDSGISKVGQVHAARAVALALEVIFVMPDDCKRRGCEQKSKARCAKCGLGYCGVDCQRRDWKDHKMVCGIAMDMDPAVRDECYKLIAGADGLAKAKAELDLN